MSAEVTSISACEHTNADGSRYTYYQAILKTGSVVTVVDDRDGVWRTAKLREYILPEYTPVLDQARTNVQER